MLSNLHIENIAVIESASIDFGSGFHVLTGETGAGKSILIDSINAVLGERVYKDIIRTGCEKASVSALFTDLGERVKKTIEDMGFSVEDDCVLIQRVLSGDGKSQSRINGRPATASLLREIADTLINIHGQHDGQALLNPDKHVQYIDALADNEAQLQNYRNAYETMKKIKSDIKKLTMDESEKQRKTELLRYQIEELEAADIKEGEREQLTARRKLYQNSEKIALALEAAYSALQGGEDDHGAVSLCSGACGSLTEAAKYLSPVSPLAEKMNDVVYELSEAADEIREQLSNIEYDSADLETIEQRLDMLYRLSLKYGDTEAEMLSFLQRIQTELESIEYSEQSLQNLHNALRNALEETKVCADRLTSSRFLAGERFATRICEELQFLDMPFVRFLVNRTECDYNHTGKDKIEFLISTNPGEPPKPLAKIASGGELSRIMLAIKNVLADCDDVNTMIFDEIDVGISGRAAQKVGLKLRETARGKQVICITHLAQIAALSDVHLMVLKEVKDNRTYTKVETLDFEGRKYEIARIMGAEITEKALASAEEMLRRTGENNGSI